MNFRTVRGSLRKDYWAMTNPYVQNPYTQKAVKAHSLRRAIFRLAVPRCNTGSSTALRCRSTRREL
jgi:hypothetical protein